MKKLFLYVTVLMMAAATAQAADPPLVIDPPVIEDAAYDWSGFYVGLNGGFASASSVESQRDAAGLVVVNGGFGIATNTYPQSGGLFGAQAGAMLQKGMFVLGVEGDVQWSGLTGGAFRPFTSGFPADDFQVQISALGSVRGKIGIAVNRVLFYATAGLALGNTQTIHRAGGVQSFNYSQTQIGWTGGLGAEFAVTDRLSIFGEYRYTDLGRATGSTPLIPLCCGITNSTTDTTIHSGLVGFNFHFNP